MSRSYKKHLVKKVPSGNGSYKSFAKNYANRKIRRIRPDGGVDVPSGKTYRKFTETWDINDWVFRYDPHPRQAGYRIGGGGPVMVEPDPVWKWRCK